MQSWSKRKQILTFGVVLILIISSSSAYLFHVWIVENSQEEALGSIEGTVYDNISKLGINNEFCIQLFKPGFPGYPLRQWPEDPNHRGFYKFENLTPGCYTISFAKSYAKIMLNDPTWKYIDGGYIYQNGTIVHVHPDERVIKDFYLDFYGHQSWTKDYRNLRLGMDHQSVFGYDDYPWFGNDTNLYGKNMTLEVYWNNTVNSRVTFYFQVLDIAYNNETHYSPGQQQETLTIPLDKDFFVKKAQYQQADWRINVRSLPSISIRSIEFTIYWKIS
jgi:hypothetical protein